ncbi:hypothetical protein AB0H28_14340 [Micromonospora sp. NPDC050980]
MTPPPMRRRIAALASTAVLLTSAGCTSTPGEASSSSMIRPARSTP